MLARAGIVFMAMLGVIGAYACLYLIAVFVGLALMTEPGAEGRTLPVWFDVLFGTAVVVMPIIVTLATVRIVRAIEGRGGI